MIALSFLGFLLLFLGVGISSLFRSKKNAEDYLVAGKSVPAWLTGLSAVATNNSGFMFIGMIGLTYTTGLSSIWLMIGWIIGDLMASLVAVRPIREAAQSDDIHSYGGLLAHWHGNNYITMRRIIGLLTVFFLTIYAAAQLKAGSKATSVLLDWDPSTGILVGAIIVLIYSVSGGLRASIWTDAAQAIVMLFGMMTLTWVGFRDAGGWQAALDTWRNLGPTYLAIFPDKTHAGTILFILGWVFGGIAVIGQPHVVIRFISLESPQKVTQMRLFYYSWFTVFYGLTIIVGMLSRIVFPETETFDAELALPTMTMHVLPDLFVGLILAALFAATLSTADSLILSCSAAITRDFSQSNTLHKLGAAKIVTASVLFAASIIAIKGTSTVFNLVLDAWGMLGSAFVPITVIYALRKPCNEKQSIFVIFTGLLVFIGFQQSGLGSHIYSAAPGILAGFMAYLAIRIVTSMKEARKE